MSPSEMMIRTIIERSGYQVSRYTIAAVVWKTLHHQYVRDWLDISDEEFVDIDSLSVDRLVEIFNSTLPCFENWFTPTKEEFDRFSEA